MTKKWMGMIAGIALASGGAAFAQDTSSTTSPETQSQPANAPDSMGSQPSDQLGNDSAAAAGAEQQQGVGGSGAEGTSADTSAQTGTGGAGQSSTQPATPATPASPSSSKSQKDDPAAASADAQSEQQLTATVEKVQGKTVFVDHQGAVVALTTNKSTQFEGVKRARELQEGQQIRASFTVKNGTMNLAKSIAVEGAGTGGAGLENQGGLETGTPPAETGAPPADTGSTPPADTGSTTEPGTGGSGLEGSSGSTSGSEAGTGGSGLEDPASSSTQPESEMDHRGLETEGQGGAGEAGSESTDTSTGGDKY